MQMNATNEQRPPDAAPSDMDVVSVDVEGLTP